MKKIRFASLALCLVLVLPITLLSCAHKCAFAADWSMDENAHWHACTKEDCAEIADKADHTWNEGEITTAASQEADGVKTFTCTVCAQTKTEAVAFTGMTKEEWDAALHRSVFENFIYKEVSTVRRKGVTVETEMLCKFTKNDAWVRVTIAGESEAEYAPDAASARETRNELYESIKDLAAYKDYAYDAETKTYKATRTIRIDSLQASTSDITLKFSEGKLVEIQYRVVSHQDGANIITTSTITLSKYGEVVLNHT